MYSSHSLILRDHAILYKDTTGHYVMDSTVTADPFVFCE